MSKEYAVYLETGEDVKGMWDSGDTDGASIVRADITKRHGKGVLAYVEYTHPANDEASEYVKSLILIDDIVSIGDALCVHENNFVYHVVNTKGEESIHAITIPEGDSQPYVSRSIILDVRLLRLHVQHDDDEVTFVSMFSEGSRCLIACKVKDKNIGSIIIWDFEVTTEQPQTVSTITDFKDNIGMIRRQTEN